MFGCYESQFYEMELVCYFLVELRRIPRKGRIFTINRATIELNSSEVNIELPIGLTP